MAVGQMTNQEINEAVARKLGWIKPTREFEPWKHSSMPDAIMRTRDEMPKYSTSIEAAWEIVDRRKEYKRDIILLMAYEHPGYCCRMADMINGKADMVEAEADTAPKAICLAFLKLP